MNQSEPTLRNRTDEYLSLKILITNHSCETKKRTLLGHMQEIPAYLLAISDYNLDVALDGLITWDETCLFFVAKDLNVTDNLVALLKAGICSAHSAYELMLW